MRHIQVSEELVEGYVLSPSHLGATLLEFAKLPGRRRVHGHARDAAGKLQPETEPHRVLNDF